MEYCEAALDCIGNPGNPTNKALDVDPCSAKLEQVVLRTHGFLEDAS